MHMLQMEFKIDFPRTRLPFLRPVESGCVLLCRLYCQLRLTILSRRVHLSHTYGSLKQPSLYFLGSSSSSLKQSRDALMTVLRLAVFLCHVLRVEWPRQLPNFTFMQSTKKEFLQIKVCLQNLVKVTHCKRLMFLFISFSSNLHYFFYFFPPS